MAGKRRASPAKRLNSSHRMIKSNSSVTVFELWEMLFEGIMYGVYLQSAVRQNFSLHQHPIRLKIEPRRTLFLELIKHTTLHQHTPPSMSSLFGRFLTGPQCVWMPPILAPWSISSNTLKRDTFDTASKTPQKDREEWGGQIAGHYPTWNKRASYYVDDDTVLLHLKTRYRVTPKHKEHTCTTFAYFDLLFCAGMLRGEHNPWFHSYVALKGILTVAGLLSFICIGNVFEVCVVEFGSLLSTLGPRLHNFILDG